MAMRLHELAQHGQSAWADHLSHLFLQAGELAELVADGVVGVTSNPTISHGAIAESDAYDEQLREVLRTETDPKEAFSRGRLRRHPGDSAERLDQVRREV